MTNTLISSDVDFEADGKQTGYLRLPHSVHRSAYGRIMIPVISIKNGKGPTVMLMAGNHGDEYEGQIALGKLSREVEAADIQGRLIILPMANQPAAQAGMRTSPIDDGNLNRAFPGNPLGTPTEAIADYIEQTLMPLCDYFIDFHSGGSSLFYPATLMRGRGQTDEEGVELKRLQSAFDAPFAWVFTSGGGPKTTSRTSMGAAGRKGAITVNVELGGAGTVTPEILAHTEQGIKKVLQSVGLLEGSPLEPPKGTRELTIVDSVISYSVGLFEPYHDIGDEVAKGDAAGAIHFPDEPWREPQICNFAATGMVLCKRVPSRVERGDCLFQLGADLDPG